MIAINPTGRDPFALTRKTHPFGINIFTARAGAVCHREKWRGTVLYLTYLSGGGGASDGGGRRHHHHVCAG
jgi:hypothetical protein